MKALFSGRFDPDHSGHWTTILKLLKIFDSVLVVVLDYPERRFPAVETKYHFDSMAVLSDIPQSRLKIIINKTHFAKLSIKEWNSYGCDVYAGGNPDVNLHMIGLGVTVYEQERSTKMSARRILPK